MGDETRKAIGLFWDIENCQVPRYVSALSVVQRLRERFFDGSREAEFMCVCDINKESKTIIEELNNGQVNVVHISATAKNAADDKIRQSLRRFADTHPPETKVVLISGDVNFATELSDLRHRKHMYIILLHGKQVHEALVSCAHEHYVYDDLMSDLPPRVPMKNLQLIVFGYPPTIALDLIKKRLTALSNNCGGRVHPVTRDEACITFPTQDALHRAKRRLEGEDVYGQRISVKTAVIDESVASRMSPSKYKSSSAQGDIFTSRSRSRDRRHHSPAPGAPGNTSPVKQFRQSSFSLPFNTAQPSTYTATQNAFATPSNFTSSAASLKGGSLFRPQDSGGLFDAIKKDSTADPLLNQTKSVGTINILQRPASEVTTTTPEVAPDLTFTMPNLSEPPPPLKTFYGPGSKDDNVSKGTVNIPTVGSFPYQANASGPRLFHPQPLYPYQTNNLAQSAFNPGPRQAAQFHFIGYRARSQSAVGTGSQPPLPAPQPIRPFLSRSLSSSDAVDDDDDDSLEAAYFKSQQQTGDRDGPVDLIVTNLDYNISKKEWRKILAATFQPQVQVLGICVRTQADNTSIASVRVPCTEDARYAISQFHRRKIGYKRINVTLNDDKEQTPAESTRQETISILSDAKAYTMPVFKFIENYEKRYHKSVSVSDLYKMKDVVDILDRGGAGRMVRLARGVCPTPSPTPEDIDDPFQEEAMDQPVCLFHCPEGSPQYAEAMSIGMLPNVRLQRKPFAAHVHSLLLSHNGIMPIMSFPTCYSMVFGMLPTAEETGVPMEHLISCVPGVEIIVSKKGVKMVHFQENKDPPGAEAICGRTSPMLSQQMALLSREIGDLLRQSRTCSIPASKFIPSYHHHFGRQCRVADYGYTKLAGLFEALPHVLQVLGTGDRKVLTLSHRAQVKRFITDVLKVLKSQPGKQLPVSDLPTAFERMLFRKFDICHYGVAFIEDMFMDIPPTSILITKEGSKTIMAIPKRDQTTGEENEAHGTVSSRDQTAEEMKRTEQFALELVDLLKHNPQCRMIFNRFIPAYHHHFGRQCRVADYGFTRLTDLFESIPQVVEILDDEEERMVKLTAPEMRRVLGEQMMGLLRESAGMVLPLNDVLLAFQRQYGFPLRLSDFGVHDVKTLLGKIKHCVQVDMREEPPLVKLQPSQDMTMFAVQVVQLLMDQSGGCLPLVELCSRYRTMFDVECDVQKIHDELLDYVQISTESDDGSALIRLSPLQVLGRDIRSLLRKAGCLALPQFSQAYQDQYFVELKPALYGYPDLPSLLKALPHIVKLTGRHGRKFVELSPILGIGTDDDEVSQISRVSSITRFEDFLSAPVPSSVPSPDLQPAHNLLPDLMSFEQSARGSGDNMWDMSEDEKRVLGSPLCRTPTSDLLHLASHTLPSPNPPPPPHDVFPADVQLTCPFPPPPPLPTDIAPPPLNEELGNNSQWPVFMRNLPQPSFPQPPPPPTLPDRPKVLGKSFTEPTSLAELPAASLQWKETLEKGVWSPTPQQMDNLASMGLLGLGQSYRMAAQNSEDHPLPSQPPPAHSISAPNFSLGWSNAQSKPASGGDSRDSMSTVYQSSKAGGGGHQGVLFPWSKYIEAQGGSPAYGPSKAAGLTSNTGCGREDSKSPDFDSVPQTLEESLSLTDGECDVTVVEKSSHHVSSPHNDTSSSQAAEATSSQKTSPSKASTFMTPAGDASTAPGDASNNPGNALTNPADGITTGEASNTATDAATACGRSDEKTASDSRDVSANEVSAENSGAFAPIPANDSFSFGQPLDTSSTRSAGSGSAVSFGSGSQSDSLSLSPSPKKNPRRARLAAKFFSPK